MGHEDGLAGVGDGSHRVEPDDGGADQNAFEAQAEDETKVVFEFFLGGREMWKIEASPAGTSVLASDGLRDPRDPGTERNG